MFTLSILAVSTVAIRFIHEVIHEERELNLKAMMAEEYTFTIPKRIVLQGMFRKHNQGFRDKGIAGPKGNA